MMKARTTVLGRRPFLKAFGMAIPAMIPLMRGQTPRQARDNSETDAINFLLNWEYLSAEFFTLGVTGASMTLFDVQITGRANGRNRPNGGTTLGGRQVEFYEGGSDVLDAAAEISTSGRKHVGALRNILGALAVAKPNLNLGSLGIGFSSEREFLVVAGLMKSLSVSAYAGVLGELSTPEIRTTVGRLLGAEAEHLVLVRSQLASMKVDPTAMLEAPALREAFGKTLAFEVIKGQVPKRTPGQILYFAYGMKGDVESGGFFPDGVNGAIRKSSESF